MDKSQQFMPWADDEEEEEQPQSQARSYDCTFCKRGFSNAQALGGHMNLHRKDRAKLKQPSIGDQEITSEVGFAHQSSSSLRLELELLTDGHEKRPTPSGFSWFLPRDHEDQIFKGQGSHEICPRQLQLFDDSPSNRVEFSVSDPQRTTMERKTKLAGEGNEPSTGKAVLDLELRLGHEP